MIDTRGWTVLKSNAMFFIIWCQCMWVDVNCRPRQKLWFTHTFYVCWCIAYTCAYLSMLVLGISEGRREPDSRGCDHVRVCVCVCMCVYGTVWLPVEWKVCLLYIHDIVHVYTLWAKMKVLCSICIVSNPLYIYIRIEWPSTCYVFKRILQFIHMA